MPWGIFVEGRVEFKQEKAEWALGNSITEASSSLYESNGMMERALDQESGILAFHLMVKWNWENQLIHWDFSFLIFKIRDLDVLFFRFFSLHFFIHKIDDVNT